MFSQKSPPAFLIGEKVYSRLSGRLGEIAEVRNKHDIESVRRTGYQYTVLYGRTMQRELERDLFVAEKRVVCSDKDSPTDASTNYSNPPPTISDHQYGAAYELYNSLRTRYLSCPECNTPTNKWAACCAVSIPSEAFIAWSVLRLKNESITGPGIKSKEHLETAARRLEVQRLISALELPCTYCHKAKSRERKNASCHKHARMRLKVLALERDEHSLVPFQQIVADPELLSDTAMLNGLILSCRDCRAMKAKTNFLHCSFHERQHQQIKRREANVSQSANNPLNNSDRLEA